MISALNRKLLRDLWHVKGQAVAIGLVVASGVAMFVMSLTTLQSLELTRRTYYERTHFAQVFAQLRQAPDVLRHRIQEIPGVAQVQTRVVKDVTLDVPGLAEPAVGRLISLPRRADDSLNRLSLRDGRFPEPGRRDEVVVGEAFTQANQLRPGDAVKAVINGRLQELTIVGIVLSPEYIFQIRSGEMMPDDRRFAVMWMDNEALSTVFNMERGFNDVSLTLLREAVVEDVLQRLDLILEPYGGTHSFARKDQISHHYLSDELTQLRTMAVLTPAIFLSVAAFLLSVVMSRIVSAEREQIAMLKAFGYGRRAIGWHYLKFVAIIVIAGVLVGTGLGIWFGRGLAIMYTEFYRFPIFLFRVDPGVLMGGVGISITFAALGTLRTVRRAMLLPPAEAMRPEPPGEFHETFLERSGFQAALSQTTRMILRELERRPLKAFFSCLGIALATSVLVLGRYGVDAMDFLMDFQFQVAQRQDVTVSFVDATEQRALSELRHMPGVLNAEGFRSVPVRLRNGPRKKELALMGLDPDTTLFRILNADGRRIPLPPDGVLMSEKLAELLHISPGESIRVEVLIGRRQVGELPVTGLISDYSGVNAYLTKDALHEFLQESPQLSGAYLDVDQDAQDELYFQLKHTPRVAGVTVSSSALQSFRDTIAENLLKMTAFNIGFSCVIAFGVVYNTARISLAERSRELATLRVIGFTRGEVSSILLGELFVLMLAGIPFGLLIGCGFAYGLSQSLQTELYRIPLVLAPFTFGFASVVVMIATLVSGLVVRRRIDHLDLIAVLKSRD